MRYEDLFTVRSSKIFHLYDQPAANVLLQHEGYGVVGLRHVRSSGKSEWTNTVGARQKRWKRQNVSNISSLRLRFSRFISFWRESINCRRPGRILLRECGFGRGVFAVQDVFAVDGGQFEGVLRTQCCLSCPRVAIDDSETS